MAAIPFSDREFKAIADLMYAAAGLAFNDSKKSLVHSRLSPRIQKLGLQGFGDYIAILHDESQGAEFQMAVDLLTTNETHFFREPAHFACLRERILPSLQAGRPLRIWSAASSTGQEAWTIAMVLARHLPQRPWEVFASDISSRVIATASRAIYPLPQAREIPPDFLQDYCLRGTGRQEGQFAIVPELRQRVRFARVNLNAPLPQLGSFDVIFLRNVLIYFNGDARRALVQRVVERLAPRGWLLVGHSESVSDLGLDMQAVMPSVYRKP